MRLLYTIILLWAAIANASDGPKNSGTLTLEVNDDGGLDGQLQIDRAVVESMIAGDAAVTVDDLLQLFRVRQDEAVCEVSSSAFVAGDKVANAVLTIKCPNRPLEVAVDLIDADKLPPDFSLGVKSASGHHSLKKGAASFDVVTSRPYLYFLAGAKFFTSIDASEHQAFNRQAALWFGGLHRLPLGSGLLALLIALVSLGLTVRSTLTLGFASLVISGLVAYAILSQAATQKVFSLLYASHTYFGLVAAIFGLTFVRRPETRRWAGIALTLLASAAYGLELATVLWKLEKVPPAELPYVVPAFMGGLTLPLTVAALAVVAFKSFAGRRQQRLEAVSPPSVVARISSVLGLVGATYAIVCLFLRIRI